MTYLDDRFAAALSAVDEWLVAEVPGVRRVTDGKALSDTHATALWDLPVLSDGRSLRMSLDADFPYSLPRFWLAGDADLAHAPHVERGGKLCLAGDGGRADTLDPVAVVKFSLGEALALISDNEAGLTDADYLFDFSAYWGRESNILKPVRTLLTNANNSRYGSAWFGNSFIVVAETDTECMRWLRNYFADKALSVKLRPAAIIWLTSLPVPSAYPSTGGAVRDIVASSSPDGLAVFDNLMAKMTDRELVVLIGSTSAGTAAQAPVLIENPTWAKSGKAPKPVYKGFRPGHAPASELARRRVARRALPQPVNAWLSRQHPEDGFGLSDRRVAIIGCGSLGAGVAELLAQSGVGALTLFDPDRLDWPNIGRHELGGSDVGKLKASSLESKFRQQFPHLRDIQAFDTTWQDAVRINEKLLSECDLLLSLTGDWNAESALNDLQRGQLLPALPPVVYGWIEQEAGAIHALAIGRKGACLRCGFTRTGSIKVPATSWPYRTSDGCSAPTGIYGATGLAPGQALVAALAIDVLLGRAEPPLRRAWLAPKAALEIGNGGWHPAWVTQYGDPSQGGYLTGTSWLKDPTCPCHRQSS